MKLTTEAYDGIRLQKTVNPTEEERLNFLEHMLRRVGIHELLCESKRPEFEEKKHWWSSRDLAFPHDCDCWLSEPFGSTGLSGDYA